MKVVDLVIDGLNMMRGVFVGDVKTKFGPISLLVLGGPWFFLGDMVKVLGR